MENQIWFSHMDERRPLSRRTVLGGVPAVLGGLAGCSSVLGTDSESTVSVLSAGSLAVTFDEGIGPAFEEASGNDYRGEFHGSKTAVRMVMDGQKRPDVIVSADATLLREELRPSIASWDVVFASNAVVIVFNPDTDVGERLDAGDPWYRVLRTADSAIARSDPDLDPLGYRTVQLFALAEDYYDRPGLADALVEKLVVDPEEAHLLSAVETGQRAAAVAYENMAVDHDLPYRSLPAELDFSDPTLADHYASVEYTTEEGETIPGRPVLYNVTIPADAPNPEAAKSFVEFLLSNPDILRESGLVVTDALPREHGDVPVEVMP